MKQRLSRYGICFLGIVPSVMFAEAPSFGEMAHNIFGPVQLVTEIMLGVSYAAGAALFIFGLLQYKTHRQNPKMVPLTMPIVLVVSGLILLALPKVTTGDWSWAATVQSKTGVQGNITPIGSARPGLHFHKTPSPIVEPPVVAPLPEPALIGAPDSLPDASMIPSEQQSATSGQQEPIQPKIFIDPDEPIHD